MSKKEIVLLPYFTHAWARLAEPYSPEEGLDVWMARFFSDLGYTEVERDGARLMAKLISNQQEDDWNRDCPDEPVGPSFSWLGLTMRPLLLGMMIERERERARKRG